MLSLGVLGAIASKTPMRVVDKQETGVFLTGEMLVLFSEFACSLDDVAERRLGA